MKEIPLSQGYVALVDDEDFERVNKFKWHACTARRKDRSIKLVYAARQTRQGEEEYLPERYVVMHRFILREPDGEVDHKSRNGLDNRRQNLRLASLEDNAANRAKSTTKRYSSRFKGVSFWKRDSNWRVSLRVNGKAYTAGGIKEEVDAATVYNFLAQEYCPEFAFVNTPETGDKYLDAVAELP